MPSLTPDDPVLYRTEVRFNAIYILESLREGEPRTGRDLYENVISHHAAALDGIVARLFRVETKHQLAAALAQVTRAVHTAGRLPILHFEMHGYEAGIELADGSLMPWRDLVPLLGDINRASRMNLIVVAIACFGWRLMDSLMPNVRAPLFMLVGPPDTMTPSELLVATSDFYTSLLKHLDVNLALEAMNAGVDYSAWRLKPGTAEILFCRAFRAFIAEGNTFESTPEMENQIVADAVKRQSLDIIQAAAIREQVRRNLDDPRWWYNHLRTLFLWIDHWPDHDKRFGLDYDLCYKNARD
jgi:hypothetical protein